MRCPYPLPPRCCCPGRRYIGGRLQAKREESRRVTQRRLWLRVGAHADGQAPFLGQIRGVQLHASVRSAQQLRQDMNGERGAAPSGPYLRLFLPLEKQSVSG